MKFSIRTKLLLALTVLLLPFILLFALSYYVNRLTYDGIHWVQDIHEEMHAVGHLQLALERALMPGNDYIITGDPVYRDRFRQRAAEVEVAFERAEQALAHLAEYPWFDPQEGALEASILEEVRDRWRNIERVSLAIFAIPDPVGDPAAAALMEEMDYQWSEPAAARLEEWHEIDKGEYQEAVAEADRLWQRLTLTIGGGLALLIFLFIAFVPLFSRYFTRPIRALHRGAEVLANGGFDHRIEVRTGDELEALAGSFNLMAQRLKASYGELEGQVVQRTRELQQRVEELERYQRATVQREFRIKELRDELETLKKEKQCTPRPHGCGR